MYVVAVRGGVEDVGIGGDQLIIAGHLEFTSRRATYPTNDRSVQEGGRLTGRVLRRFMPSDVRDERTDTSPILEVLASVP